MDTPIFPALLHGADYNHEQWLDRPDILDQDFACMADTRSNVMSIGIFSWARLEPSEGQYDFAWLDALMDRLHASGMKAILATPSGAKPSWMSRQYPEICRMDALGHREPHGYRHNHCRTSPRFRQAVQDMNTLLAQRYGRHPALLLWHVSNEYNGAPCFCPSCLAGFHAWLKDRYGTLEALNKAWWTDFWSHRYFDWSEIFPADKSVMGLMLDWQRYTSDLTADFFRAECAPLRKHSPAIPLTTNFQMPDVGLDFHALARDVDVVSWDAYPRWHQKSGDVPEAWRTAFFLDLQRSYKDRSFLLMECTPGGTNWQGVSRTKKPLMHRLASLQALAHGSDSVQYFQWRQSRGGEEKFHGAVMTHMGTTDTRVYKDVRALGETLARLPALAGARREADVAVVYDYQCGWALDLAQLPRNIGKDYQDQCIAWYGALWRQNIPADIIDSTREDWSRYRLVILSQLYLFRPGVAEKIRAFTEAGGTVVATCNTGLADNSDLAFAGGFPGGLTDLFGMAVEAPDSLADDEGQTFRWQDRTWACSHFADIIQVRDAQVEATFGTDSRAGEPALLSRVAGRGRAWYLATRPEPAFLDAFTAHLARQADIAACGPGGLPEGVSVRSRTGREHTWYFFLNFTDSSVHIDMGAHPCHDAETGGPAGSRMHLAPRESRILVCPSHGAPWN